MNSYKNTNSYIFYLILLILFNSSVSSPLSRCKKGIFSYTKDESINSKTCNLSPITKDTYPVAINKDIFDSFTKAGQCGICYEMVGTTGAVKIRVDDVFEESGDSTPYFKIGTEASKILLGIKDINDLKENIKKSITFRMISCDYSDKIKILTGDDNLDGFSFSCLVLNSNIAVYSIRIKENGSSSYEKLEKNSKNYWVYEKGNSISYPVELKITSITGESVDITIPNKEPGETYETNGNFVNSEGSLYEIDKLTKDKDSSEPEKCCFVDFSIYTKIYSNGKLNQNYEITNTDSTLDSSSSESLNVKFSKNGKLIIKSSMPIRADQFIMISLLLKGNKICKDCLYLSAYGKNIDKKLSIDEENTNQNYNFPLTSIGVEDNTFNGIIIYTKDKDIDINIVNIELLKNTDAPNTEICLGNTTDWNPIIPIEKTNTQEPIKTEKIIIPTSIIVKNLEIVNVTINNISLINNTFISFNCTQFKRIEGEQIKLIFNSSSNNFQTQRCFIDDKKEYIQNFDCEIENILNIDSGEYSIRSPNDTKYQANSLGKVEIIDGKLNYKIISISIPKTNIVDNSNQIDESITIITKKKKFVIINSIDKEINKGDNILFEVDPITTNEIISNINEIILTNGKYGKDSNALHLKKCTNIIKDNKITSISCIVSNNIIKDDYTTLVNEQNIELDKNKMIKLRCLNSSGGSFFSNMNETINANISKYEKSKKTLTFNITYYSNILSPNQLFPYNVSLYGNRINNLRNLDNENYNTKITFPNCTMGSLSNQTQRALNGIICNLPNFVQAGKYTKIESDGFDCNPNNQINIEFPYDFNKSESYAKSQFEPYDVYIPKESSSSSKTWIIWLIAGILVAALIVIIIIAFCVKRKRIRNDDNKEVNDSGANQINNSNNISKTDKSNNSTN